MTTAEINALILSLSRWERVKLIEAAFCLNKLAGRDTKSSADDLERQWWHHMQAGHWPVLINGWSPALVSAAVAWKSGVILT